jgi:dihydrofolate reductase
MISAIVAVDENWGIGFNGQLLEHNPVDMKHFKNLTETGIVICGRKTWESIPNHPLSKRLAIVITNQGFKVEPGAIFLDMHHAMNHINYIKDDNKFEWFVIGGGEIYNQLLPYCDRVYVTKFYTDHNNVDTYFPNLDELKEWEIVATTMKQVYNNIPYQFLTYDRIS